MIREQLNKFGSVILSYFGLYTLYTIIVWLQMKFLFLLLPRIGSFIESLGEHNLFVYIGLTSALAAVHLWAKVRKKTLSFRDSMVWAISLLIILMFVFSVLNPHIDKVYQDKFVSGQYGLSIEHDLKKVNREAHYSVQDINESGGMYYVSEHEEMRVFHQVFRIQSPWVLFYKLGVEPDVQLNIRYGRLTEAEIKEVIRIAGTYDIKVKNIFYECIKEDDEYGECGFDVGEDGSIQLKLVKLHVSFNNREFKDDIKTDDFHKEYDFIPSTYYFGSDNTEYDILIDKNVYHSISIGDSYEDIIRAAGKRPIAIELSQHTHAVFIYLADNGWYELTFKDGILKTKEHITINTVYRQFNNRWAQYQLGEKIPKEESSKKLEEIRPLTFNFSTFVSKAKKDSKKLSSPFPKELLTIQSAKFSPNENHNDINATTCYNEKLEVYYNSLVNLYYDAQTQKLVYAGEPFTAPFEGEGIVFTEDGKIDYIGNHQDCEKHGDVIEYSKDGKVIYQGSYTYGKKN